MEDTAPPPRVSAAGLVVDVHADDPADARLVARLLGRTPATGASDVTLTVGPRPSLPERPPDFRGPYGDHWQDDGVHHFRHSWGLTMVADADSIVLGGPAAGHERWVTVRNSMLFALATVLMARDRFLVHGAAVRRGDSGVLAVGDSGSGKSTFGFAASRHGWRLLGDDMVVVDRDPDGGRPRVQGVPRLPSLPGDVAAAEAVSGDPLPGDVRERIELHWLELDPRASGVDAVVVCDHGEVSSSLAAIPGHEAIVPLVSGFVLSELPGPLRRWFPVAVQLSRGPVLRYHHDASPAERAGAVGRHLDELWERLERGPQAPYDPAATSSR